MYRFLVSLTKLVIASLVTGALLSRLNLSAEDILKEMGLTPENVMELVDKGISWATPNIILGSMVILPVWVVVSLFRPPRS